MLVKVILYCSKLTSVVVSRDFFGECDGIGIDADVAVVASISLSDEVLC